MGNRIDSRLLFKKQSSMTFYHDSLSYLRMVRETVSCSLLRENLFLSKREMGPVTCKALEVTGNRQTSISQDLNRRSAHIWDESVVICQSLQP